MKRFSLRFLHFLRFAQKLAKRCAPAKPCARFASILAAILRERWAHLRYFEYWPTRIFYLPVYPLVLYWALRLRSLGFMSAVNPCMEYGGLLNYSKFRVLSLLPQEYLLRGCLVSCGQSDAQIAQALRGAGLGFPLIAKPDFGERGFGVQIVRSFLELQNYVEGFRRLQNNLQKQNSRSAEIILQEYFAPAQEFAVLYSISPAQAERGEMGEIRSICAKKPLCVEGDGKSSLGALVARCPRAANRYRLLRKMWGAQWQNIVPAGQSQQLTHIGAHGLGTDCHSIQHRNGPRLLRLFAQLSAHLNASAAAKKPNPNLNSRSNSKPNFCFGRYDILAESWEELLQGRFKVIELNGVNAEPLHIYHPKFSLWAAWKTLWRHWQRIGRLAEQMQKRGHKAISSLALLRAVRQHDRKVRLYRKSALVNYEKIS